LKKSLHDDYGPKFKDLFSKKDENIKVEVEKNGRPKLWQLAEKIAFTSLLEYDENGILKVDFTVFQERFWKNNRPCFIKEENKMRPNAYNHIYHLSHEENKVLNTIHALLLASSQKREEEIDYAQRIYSQNLPGINEPVLKSMCLGPVNVFKPVDQEDVDCDLKRYENERILKFKCRTWKMFRLTETQTLEILSW
jgi:hypothetical protein